MQIAVTFHAENDMCAVFMHTTYLPKEAWPNLVRRLNRPQKSLFVLEYRLALGQNAVSISRAIA